MAYTVTLHRKIDDEGQIQIIAEVSDGISRLPKFYTLDGEDISRNVSDRYDEYQYDKDTQIGDSLTYESPVPFKAEDESDREGEELLVLEGNENLVPSHDTNIVEMIQKTIEKYIASIAAMAK